MSYDDLVLYGSPPTISIPVGITIGLLASLVQSLGLTIQRKSHIKNQEAPVAEQRLEHRRPLWLLGFGIFITSNILGSVFQIASLPVVILAPLGAVSLLWNALFARIILGDLFSKFMIIGTLLIVAGAVLIARFGIVPEPTHSLDDLLALFRRETFVIYFSLLGATLCICLIATHLLEWSTYKHIRSDSRFSTSPSSSGTTTPIPLTRTASERTPLLQADRKNPPSVAPSSSSMTASPLQRYKRRLNLLAISYASASGIISGMCLIFAKSGVELLLLTLMGQNQFWRWESWVLVGGLVVFALLQLWYLHKSLVLADPTLVCPLAFCFYNISSIFNGLVYYDQLNLLSPLQLSLVITGIAVLLVGVWAVSIQTDDEEEIAEGVREGDWIPADEEGVATALAPADIVRIVERATGTLPSRLDTSISSLPEQPSPQLSPLPNHKRVRSHQSHIHPLNTNVPRFSSTFLSPDSPAPNLPGFSIGISATSPGFIVGPRRRTEMPSSPNGSKSRGFMRRVVSEGTRNLEQPESEPPSPEGRRRANSHSVERDEEAILSPREETGNLPGNWLGKFVRWNRNTPSNGNGSQS